MTGSKTAFPVWLATIVFEMMTGGASAARSAGNAGAKASAEERGNDGSPVGARLADAGFIGEARCEARQRGPALPGDAKIDVVDN